MNTPAGRLARIVLTGEPLSRLSPALEADRAQAIADLTADNHFAPLSRPDQTNQADQAGQADQADQAGEEFGLHLSILDGRLVFDIRDGTDAPITAVVLALGPFRRLIKDYQMLVESYMLAVLEGREARIQAIDMGRRGLHNEGATLLMTRLEGKIALDFDTARRLFTLVTVLHQRG